ncbi:MAG: hypothetical protein KatS3mg115_0944 [Candidatus Poribacteria bacterium]|nr:MAG: hypothetical protein KatS3mg115_0944 [Candidatus Poribacteria bacterium]
MRVLAVSVGGVRMLPDRERGTVATGIFKAPASGRVRLTRLGFEGDAQADRKAHGGPDRAAYAYTIEDYRYWEERLGRPSLPFGGFGENLTVEGMPSDRVRIGDRYRIGEALVEVTHPRVPCYKLGLLLDCRRWWAGSPSRGGTGSSFGCWSLGPLGRATPSLWSFAIRGGSQLPSCSGYATSPTRTRRGLLRRFKSPPCRRDGRKRSAAGCLRTVLSEMGYDRNGRLVPGTNRSTGNDADWHARFGVSAVAFGADGGTSPIRRFGCSVSALERRSSTPSLFPRRESRGRWSRFWRSSASRRRSDRLGFRSTAIGSRRWLRPLGRRLSSAPIWWTSTLAALSNGSPLATGTPVPAPDCSVIPIGWRRSPPRSSKRCAPTGSP